MTIDCLELNNPAIGCRWSACKLAAYVVISTSLVISNENEKSFLCLFLLATKLQDISHVLEMTIAGVILLTQFLEGPSSPFHSESNQGK
jgi:hypothetical protein